jgi:hypothetical protein
MDHGQELFFLSKIIFPRRLSSRSAFISLSSWLKAKR